MSWDYSARNNTPCDHLEILERYTVSYQDFRTLQYAANTSLNMRAPINGASQVRLYFKGELVKPDHPAYGYSLVPDPTRVQAGYTFYKIVFNHPVRTLSPLIEVSYFTRPGFCMKCGGTGTSPDWSVSPAGGLNHTTGVQKLTQQVEKYLLSSTNPFNPNLVCPIRTYVGKKFGVTVTDQDVATSAMQILSKYQMIQRAQASVQTLDPNEMLKDITSVQAMENPNDPTRLYLNVALQAYGTNEAIPLSLALQTT